MKVPSSTATSPMMWTVLTSTGQARKHVGGYLGHLTALLAVRAMSGAGLYVGGPIASPSLLQIVCKNF